MKLKYFFYEHYVDNITLDGDIETLKCISSAILYNTHIYYHLWSYDNEKELNNAIEKLTKRNITYLLGKHFDIMNSKQSYKVNEEYTGVYVLDTEYDKSKFIRNDELKMIHEILLNDPFGD